MFRPRSHQTALANQAARLAKEGVFGEVVAGQTRTV